MKDVEELLRKIIKQANDEDASYICGVEYSNDTDPDYKALVRFTKEGVSPVMVAAKTKRQLKKELNNYLNGDTTKDVNIRFHEAQIELEQKSIRFHRDCIHDYEHPPTELPA